MTSEAVEPVAAPRIAWQGRAWSIDDLRTLARRRIPRAIFDQFDGAAEDEIALRENREAFRRQRLLPKVLVDVSKVDTRTTILGHTSALPLVIAPTGAVGFGRRGGDVMIARAASAFGIPYTLSTSATASIEQIAEAAPGRHWFQAYILQDREFTYKLIERARVAGYDAVMITVDLPVGGKRERDYRNDFSLPFRYTRRNLIDFATRPRWALDMVARGLPVMENLRGFIPRIETAEGIASTAGRNYDPSFDWTGLQAIRDQWRGKLILKGIVRPDDAERAVRMGADAIVVSNHGGRQLDASVPTLDLLPAVVAAVAGRCSVMVDGGVRRGSDIVKAVALGADAVLAGRPALYGVFAAGEQGAQRALEIFAEELTRTMQLCGLARIEDITSDCLARANLRQG
jgi:(S)-mandelate dehydrogenase